MRESGGRGGPGGRREPTMIGESADFLHAAQRRNPCGGPGISRAIGYNFRLLRTFAAAMEAERINQIAASLADLTQRTAELRRYL